MNWFVYGYRKREGHGFHTPVDQQFESETYSILHQGIYGDIPNDTAFVGHFRARKRWLILVKRAGEGDVLGRLLTEEQYRRYGFSPYRLVSEEVTDAPVTNMGSPLPMKGLTFPIAIAPGNDYIDVCARFFEGFSEDRRRVPHRSVSSKSATEAQALFRLDENAGSEALDRLIGDGTTGGGRRRGAQDSDESARFNRLESRIVELERREVPIPSPPAAGPDVKQIESRVARLEDIPRALASIRTALARMEDRIDTVGVERREIPPPSPTDAGPEIEQIESRVAQLEDLLREIASIRTALARLEGLIDTPRERSVGKPSVGETELLGQPVKKPVWRRLKIMTAGAVVLTLGVLGAFIYASPKNEIEALKEASLEEAASRQQAVADLKEASETGDENLQRALDTKLAEEAASQQQAVADLKEASETGDENLQRALDTKLAEEAASRQQAVADLKEASETGDENLQRALDTKLAEEAASRQRAVADLKEASVTGDENLQRALDTKLAEEAASRQQAVADLKEASVTGDENLQRALDTKLAEEAASRQQAVAKLNQLIKESQVRLCRIEQPESTLCKEAPPGTNAMQESTESSGSESDDVSGDAP